MKGRLHIQDPCSANWETMQANHGGASADPAKK